MGRLVPKSDPGLYGVSVWKSMRSGWPNFSCYVQFDIGDGSMVESCHGV